MLVATAECLGSGSSCAARARPAAGECSWVEDRTVVTAPSLQPATRHVGALAVSGAQTAVPTSVRTRGGAHPRRRRAGDRARSCACNRNSYPTRVRTVHVFAPEPCVLHTFGSVDFPLGFICGQSVSEFLRDGLPASIQFPVMPKHAQYARFGGETGATS